MRRFLCRFLGHRWGRYVETDFEDHFFWQRCLRCGLRDNDPGPQ
jgi:hypothetical protein